VPRRAAAWRSRRAGGSAGRDQRRAAHPRRRADQRERQEVRLRRPPRATRRSQGARLARGPCARASAPRSRAMARRGLSSDRASIDDGGGSAGWREARMSWTLRTDPSDFATRWSDGAAARYRAAGYWRDETLADVARRACLEAPDRLLLIEGDRRVTRAEAWDAASRLAAFFLSRGLKPGDVVSFQLPNWIEAAVIALAARRCGLVLNPIPPNYRESEVSYILDDCRAKVVFVPQVFRKHDHRRMLQERRPQRRWLQDVVVVRGDGGGGVGWLD